VLLDGVNILRPEQDLNLLRARVGWCFKSPLPFPCRSMTISLSASSSMKSSRRASLPTVSRPLEARALGMRSRINCTLRAYRFRAVSSSVSASAHRGPPAGSDFAGRTVLLRSIPSRPRKSKETIDELKENYTIAIVTHNMQQGRASRTIPHSCILGTIEFGITAQVFTHLKRSRRKIILLAVRLIAAGSRG